MFKVIGNIVHYYIFSSTDKNLSKVPVTFNLAKAVDKSFCNHTFVSLIHQPKHHIVSVITIGICNIEYVSQSVLNITVNKKRNASCAFVYPSTELVPSLDFSTSGCIRFLSINQNLVFETVLVVVSGSCQETHPTICILADFMHLFLAYCRCYLQFICQLYDHSFQC
ncbi:MAG: hypothetical protein PHY15_00945 [Eubacteriales bacterium]|nr:hypothetical protein [Eubacteriales bacterium]MDD4474377.1 hypothetical protein [Eubacteriales bacterium]